MTFLIRVTSSLSNDYVCIGGIKDSGNWNQAADPVNRNAILSRAYTMFQDLKVD